MIINIASLGGRTHLLDTARELAKYGHVVRFYSYVPTKRAMKYGLPKESSYTLFYLVFPFLVLFKLFGFGGWREYLYNKYCDILLAYYMKPCDVFIGQSPLHYYSIKRAKKKFGALTILERGTIHVLDYQKRLESAGLKPQNRKLIIRDLKGYNNPDYISVGSIQVRDSLVKYGIPSPKIFVNNYGFNPQYFSPTVLQKNNFDLLMVGRWSKMKGADIILEACKNKGYSFLHVGGLVDPFPTLSNMQHLDSIDEQMLYKYYAKARVFVLPSRCEGLALVQLQAMACGLPIFCSAYSGGRDLKKYIKEGEWIFEMKEFSVSEFIRNVDIALHISTTQIGERSYLNDKFAKASWKGYGERYHLFLQNTL